MHFLTQKLSLSTPKVKGAGPALVFCLHHYNKGCPSFAGFAKLGTTDLALADPVMQPSLRSSLPLFIYRTTPCNPGTERNAPAICWDGPTLGVGIPEFSTEPL